MTAEQFRQLALSVPGATEGTHMRHPDFRVKGRIFATLGYPDDQWGMAKLPPARQRELISRAPGVFVPARGAWGLGGSTLVRLEAADEAQVRDALGEAHAAALALAETGRKAVGYAKRPARR